MTTAAKFRAVHASGMVVPNYQMVTALALLFEKVYLPSNIEAVINFSRKFRFMVPDGYRFSANITYESEPKSEKDPFEDLSPTQKETAFTYLHLCRDFALANVELFGPVFETDAFEEGVSAQSMVLKGEDESVFPHLLEEGYVPVIGKFGDMEGLAKRLDQRTAKQLATLLAMQSVEMLLPRTRGAKPEAILEARERLRDHLPPFWSAMFKLSAQLRSLLNESPPSSSVQVEAENLVDSIVRPALIDLKHKMELERKQWFYHILSPIQKGLRLMVGNPPLSQQQLITNALVLASDVAVSAAENIRAIESLKQGADLTYLLELEQLIHGESAEPIATSDGNRALRARRR